MQNRIEESEGNKKARAMQQHLYNIGLELDKLLKPGASIEIRIKHTPEIVISNQPQSIQVITISKPDVHLTIEPV